MEKSEVFTKKSIHIQSILIVQYKDLFIYLFIFIDTSLIYKVVKPYKEVDKAKLCAGLEKYLELKYILKIKTKLYDK